MTETLEEGYSFIDSDHIIITVLQVLSSTPWPKISFKLLSYHLKVSPSFIYSYFKNKNDILQGIFRFTDKNMENLYRPQAYMQNELTLHEILFEIIMCRLEVMAPYKNAFNALTQAVFYIPFEGCEISKYFFTSLEKILNIAQVDTKGIQGFLKSRFFAIIYYQILQQWFQDITADHSLTLAAIDKNLLKFTRMIGQS